MKTRAGLDVAGATDAGCVRPNNEDNFVIEENLGLLVVADGMGGHNSGEVAAALAVQTIVDFARRMRGAGQMEVPEGGDARLSLAGRQLEYFFKSANTMIYEKGRALPKDSGMGTTVVAALADDRQMAVAHVGDSRLYVLRDGRLEVLTQDHSLVGEQLRKGLISPEEAARSSLQNILTRALGAEEDVSVDVSDHTLLPGDVLLLASDGLTKMLPDGEIARLLAERGSPERVAAALIAAAKGAGGVDNVTVIVARVPGKPGGRLKSLMSRFFGGEHA